SALHPLLASHGAPLLLGLAATPARAAIVYVGIAGDSVIEKFTASGVGSIFATEEEHSFPEGLAFDQAGNLFVANAGNNTIQKFTPSGSASLFASAGSTNIL